MLISGTVSLLPQRVAAMHLARADAFRLRARVLHWLSYFCAPTLTRDVFLPSAFTTAFLCWLFFLAVVGPIGRRRRWHGVAQRRAIRSHLVAACTRATHARATDSVLKAAAARTAGPCVTPSSCWGVRAPFRTRVHVRVYSRTPLLRSSVLRFPRCYVVLV